MKQEERDRVADRLDSIYLNMHSLECGLLAAGGVLAVVDKVICTRHPSTLHQTPQYSAPDSPVLCTRHPSTLHQTPQYSAPDTPATPTPACTPSQVLSFDLPSKTYGLAVVRPPGHHAEPDSPNGFCIFNNVAIAAEYAVRGHGLARVLVLDWDVHHGNGIQHMFYESSNVLYISIHRWEGGVG